MAYEIYVPDNWTTDEAMTVLDYLDDLTQRLYLRHGPIRLDSCILVRDPETWAGLVISFLHSIIVATWDYYEEAYLAHQDSDTTHLNDPRQLSFDFNSANLPF